MPSNTPAEISPLLSQLGPSGPEGLRRCARNASTRWKILLPLSVCFLLAGLAGLFLRPDRRPDLPLLQKRFELLMTWTLPEIHCDDMHLSGLHKQGKEWLATYRFVVYATQGSDCLLYTSDAARHQGPPETAFSRMRRTALPDRKSLYGGRTCPFRPRPTTRPRPGKGHPRLPRAPFPDVTAPAGFPREPGIS